MSSLFQSMLLKALKSKKLLRPLKGLLLLLLLHPVVMNGAINVENSLKIAKK